MKYQYPLSLVFKITTLSSDFTVSDARDKSLFYVRQKMFKLLEEVVVCKDSTQAQQLYTIKANKWLDFSAAYNFTNTAGQDLGKVARKGWASIVTAHYEIFDAREKTRLYDRRGRRKRAVKSFDVVVAGKTSRLSVVGCVKGIDAPSKFTRA